MVPAAASEVDKKYRKKIRLLVNLQGDGVTLALRQGKVGRRRHGVLSAQFSSTVRSRTLVPS